MKKVLLFGLLFLFLAPAAKAQVPALKDTAPYKGLRTYVISLEGISSATTEEKQGYTSELSARVQAAEAQVVILFDRRKKQLEKNYDAILKKRYTQIKKRAKSRISTARKESAKEQKSAQRKWEANKQEIQNAYGARLRPLEKRIATLRKQKANSTDPREQALIDEEINLLQRKVSRIEAIIEAETKEALVAYQREIKRIKRILNNSINSIQDQEGVERREAKKAWQAEKKEALSALRNQRRIDNALVSELKVRGQESISAMTVTG